MAFLTPTAAGEAAVTGNFVRNQFAQVRSSVYGLSDEQLHRRSTVSDFTLAALVDHVGLVAEQYGAGVAAARDGRQIEYGDGVSKGEAESVEGFSAERILADFDRRVGTVETLLSQAKSGELALDTPVAVPPAPWFPPELTHWEARWVLLHLATETARHAGHADIIRESIDGKGSYELNALADGQSWGDWG